MKIKNILEIPTKIALGFLVICAILTFTYLIGMIYPESWYSVDYHKSHYVTFMSGVLTIIGGLIVIPVLYHLGEALFIFLIKELKE